LTFNDKTLSFSVNNKSGTVVSSLDFAQPKFSVPELNKLSWKYLDSLPELQATYDDSAWTSADLVKTYNSLRPLTTPTSLYSSDYGYHTGTLLYRGHFTATGSESSLYLSAQGGSAFGFSAFVNNTFIGSWYGYDAATNGNKTFTLPNLVSGKSYVITVVIDNMGLDEDWTIGTETMKNPRGILDYKLDGHNASSVSWKLTGNLGGEDYKDISRGPLNEGGMFVERQGLHLPGALKASDYAWKDSAGPVSDGITNPGIGYFATEFTLDLPKDYDIPMSFTFSNSTSSSNTTSAYRVQIFVNGWQFGKYVSNVGPQTTFPVPEGILNYHGTNYLGVTLWGLDAGATKIEGFELGNDSLIWSGYPSPSVVEGETYEKREGAY
jgi:hypothetical protein